MKHKLSPKSDSSTTDDVFVWDQITLWSKSAKCHIFQPSKFLLEHPQSVAFRQLRSTLQVRSILLILVITNIACRPLRTKYFCPWPRENLHTQPISWGEADFWTRVDWISKLAGVAEKVGSTHSGCRVTWGALWPWELTATFAPAPRIAGEYKRVCNCFQRCSLWSWSGPGAVPTSWPATATACSGKATSSHQGKTSRASTTPATRVAKQSALRPRKYICTCLCRRCFLSWLQVLPNH